MDKIPYATAFKNQVPLCDRVLASLSELCTLPCAPFRQVLTHILFGDIIAWKTAVFGINSMSGVRKFSLSAQVLFIPQFSMLSYVNTTAKITVHFCS